MKRSTCVLMPALFMLSASAIALAAPVPHPMAPASTTAPATSAPKLDAAMRSLWHGHVVHTREYAMAVHGKDVAKEKQAADAVVANARQIADAVGSYYGKPAGEQMLTLLAGHWGGVKALTDATAAGDSAGASKAMADLNSNGEAIATFLSGANPNLPKDAVQGLLATHVAHHSAQINQIMSGDTKDEAQTWDAMQKHMDVLADALTAGIAKQFPDKAK